MKKQWGVYTYNRSIEVVPEWEKPEHDRGVECKCVPQMEIVGQKLLVRHSAFDGTHLIEDAETLTDVANLCPSCLGKGDFGQGGKCVYCGGIGFVTQEEGE